MIEDFIPVYPNQEDPNIQKIISGKMEFSELEPKIIDPIPKPGELYNHQKMFIRLMRLNDRMLNIQETGTGKSCAFIAACEYFKKTGIYKTAYIFEKGPTTVSEMKNQIVKKCTKNVYDLDITENNSSKSYKIQVNRNVNKWYSIKPYRSFANQLETMDDKKIISTYSKCIFIFDEVHNLVNIGKDENSSSVEMNVYEQFKRLFTLSKQTKIALITATPMINKVEDLAVILNLILPPEKQLSLNYKYYNLLNMYQWEPYIRGMVTYIRSTEFGARPIYKGIPLNFTHKLRLPDDTTNKEPVDLKLLGNSYIPNYINHDIKSSTKIYELEMGDLQFTAYENAFHRSNIHHHENAFQTKLIDKSMFVFPNDAEHSEYLDGESYTFKSNPNFRRWKYYDPQYTNFGKWIYNNNNLSNLKRISIKLATLLEIELNSPGCSFIYTGRVEGIGGNVIMSLFKLFGFEIYSKHADNFSKVPRIAFLTSSTENEHEEILRIFNSDENIDGEYIKIIVGSPVARDGINLFHCLRCHILTPQWTPSGMIQAVNRVLRAVSHQAIVKRRMIGKNINVLSETAKKDIATVDVDIYKYAAIYPNNTKLYKDDEEIPPVDISTYLTAERKDIEIRSIMRYLKQCSIDCWINRNRNIRTRDEHFTPECDYQLCEYQCANVKTSRDIFIDYSTYNILYKDEITDYISKHIVKLVKKMGYVTVPFLISYFKSFDKYFVYYSLNKLIENKTKITNIYGFQSFITSDGYSVYTQFDFPVSVTKNESMNLIEDLYIYESMLIGVEYSGYYEYFEEQFVNNINQGLIEKFTVFYLDVASKLKDSEYTESIINFFKGLNNFEIRILVENSRSGGLIYEVIKIGLPEYFFIFEENDIRQMFQSTEFKNYLGEKMYSDITANDDFFNKTYIHMLDSINTNTTSYSTISSFLNKESKMKIMKLDENGTTNWTHANEVEKKVYSYLINLNKTSDTDNLSLYGNKLVDNLFRIVDKREEEETYDKRKKPRGRVCNSKKIEDLIEIMYLEGIKFKEFTPTEYEIKSLLKKNKIDIVKLKNSKVPISYIYNALHDFHEIYDTKMKKINYYCEIIEKSFTETNKIKNN